MCNGRDDDRPSPPSATPAPKPPLPGPGTGGFSSGWLHSPHKFNGFWPLGGAAATASSSSFVTCVRPPAGAWHGSVLVDPPALVIQIVIYDVSPCKARPLLVCCAALGGHGTRTLAHGTGWGRGGGSQGQGGACLGWWVGWWLAGWLGHARQYGHAVMAYPPARARPRHEAVRFGRRRRGSAFRPRPPPPPPVAPR